MKNNIKSVISLTVICAVISVLLAITNSITEPIIKKQENSAVNETLSKVLPGGKDFEKLDISSYELPNTITEAYRESSGGYVFKMVTAGYGSDFILMCGVDSEGKVAGAACISSKETLGAENEYGQKLVGAAADTIDSVDTITGATKTTEAYKNAVKDALNAAIILGGGSVDIRTDEQILADNLNAALPDAKGKFTSVFITEDIGDISAVYKADNNKGFVFVYGEKFVATDSQGNVINETDEQIKALISAAAQKIINSTMSDVDISSYELPSHVQKVYKTASGNYVFDLRAAGYGINGDKYTRSDEYIYIRVSATPDGRIIACQTVSQKESKGYGEACADPTFYTQFNNKNESNYNEIDAISGATITTNGYKAAISKVFEAIKILKGETR
ncbi:MAG: FMN-binding protein [Acutalibacteraceae bacterium]|jgi:electron transport complex protein RnfG